MASRTRLLVMIALASVAGATGWARAQDTTQQQPAGTTPGTQTPTATPPVQPEQPAQEPAVVPPPAPAAPVPTPVPAPSVGVEEVQANPADAAAAPVKRGKQQFGEEIVVTGSRIRRKDLTTPAPVTVLSREQVQASGRVSIGDFLQSLPEQGNAINTAVNNGGDGATRINLRNLGTARTLVLINGRRMVPGGTGADDSVDLNSIPVSAIERIEILKDGASAVYGSDAIAGVVNIITRRKFQGAEISVYGGTSQHGDGQTYDVNGTIGTSNEKGGVMFSAGFFKQEKVMAGDRDFSKIARGFDATGQNNPQGNPPGEYSYGNSGTVPAGSFSIPASAAGKVVPLTGDPEQDAKIALYNSIVTASPTKTKFVRDPAAPNGWRPFVSLVVPPQGDAYNTQPENYLITPQQRISLYSAGDHQLGDLARAYFEASYVNRQSRIQLAAEPFTGGAYDFDTTVSKDSIYNPFGVDIRTVNRRLLEFGNRVHEIEINTVRGVAGLDGTLPDQAGPLQGWFWDLSLNFGRTTGSEIDRGSILLPNVASAVGPSFVDPTTGAPTCGTPGSPIANCVPLNLFGGGIPPSITPDMTKNLQYAGVKYGTNQMTAVQANVNGELITLPTAERPIGLAVGYEYRRLTGSFTPDPITALGWSSDTATSPTVGGYYSNEGYAELSVPLVANLPFAESIEATAAIRAFDYSTFGSDYTYKFGGRWTPVSDVTVRGTYSTAFRAPSISDLFSGQSDNFANVSDPCAKTTGPLPANCTGNAAANGDDRTQLRSKIGGNPKLTPEKAKVYTAGVVFAPRWVKNLTMTVDYYNIELTNAIAQIGESVILASCYPTNGQAPKYCQYIDRDPSTGQISRITNLKANVGGEKTAGVDLALRYSVPTEEFGRFGFVFDGTWLKNFDIIQADGTVVTARGNYDLASQGTGGQGGVLPAWKFNAGVNWGLGGLGAGVNVRFLGSWHECGDSFGDFSGSGVCEANNTYKREVPAWSSWDTFLSYGFNTVAGRTNVAGGVQNLFNVAPANVYNGFTSSSDPTAYDFMGRFFYLRLSQSI